MTVSGRDAPWRLKAALLSRALEGRNAPPDAGLAPRYIEGLMERY
jgi:hypothetical protein